METKKRFFTFNVYENENSEIRFEVRKGVNDYQAIRDVISYLGFNDLDGEYDLMCRGNTTQINRKSRVSDIINNCINIGVSK